MIKVKKRTKVCINCKYFVPRFKFIDDFRIKEYDCKLDMLKTRTEEWQEPQNWGCDKFERALDELE